jgi:DMSO/TMAO reductase YedYZ molybdopterin-dependent catalytic subunit
MNGKPLTHEHGAPLRLISPYDLGYKSIKYVTGIDFVKTAQPGWWTLANPIYPANAPVPASRLRKK